MKEYSTIFVVGMIILIAGGCSKKGNPVTPEVPANEFPADAKFSVTLYCPSPSVAVGESFEVRVVLYNVTNVSGMAITVTFPTGSIDVLGLTSGSTFFPPDSTISISNTEADSGRISYGVSYKNTASGASKSGSGLICTVKCRATASGTASFVIDRNTLQIGTPDGTLIGNFATLLVENCSVTIH
jgi:hypothetical protein